MCLYKNNFCLAERSIHESYLCLANISSFLWLYFRLCKKPQGLRASHKHNQNMHISRSAVYQDGVGTTVTASAFRLAAWQQSSLQLREGFGYTGDSNCCSLSGWHRNIKPNSTPCSHTQYPPPALLSLHGSPVRASIWITILRVASFSSRAWEALSWWCWILLTAGIALQILGMNCTFDKHLDAVIYFHQATRWNIFSST